MREKHASTPIAVKSLLLQSKPSGFEYGALKIGILDPYWLRSNELGCSVAFSETNMSRPASYEAVGSLAFQVLSESKTNGFHN